MKWSSVFCVFGMTLTRPPLTMLLTSGVGVFAHVAGKRQTLRATIVTIFSHIPVEQERFQFLSNVTWFLDCFFGNYHKFELLNFAGQCSNILKVWWELLHGFCSEFTSLSSSDRTISNFENPLWIDKVIAMSLVYYFFGTQCIGKTKKGLSPIINTGQGTALSISKTCVVRQNAKIVKLDD